MVRHFFPLLIIPLLSSVSHLASVVLQLDTAADETTILLHYGNQHSTRLRTYVRKINQFLMNVDNTPSTILIRTLIFCIFFLGASGAFQFRVGAASSSAFV